MTRFMGGKDFYIVDVKRGKIFTEDDFNKAKEFNTKLRGYIVRKEKVGKFDEDGYLYDPDELREYINSISWKTKYEEVKPPQEPKNNIVFLKPTPVVEDTLDFSVGEIIEEYKDIPIEPSEEKFDIDAILREYSQRNEANETSYVPHFVENDRNNNSERRNNMNGKSYQGMHTAGAAYTQEEAQRAYESAAAASVTDRPRAAARKHQKEEVPKEKKNFLQKINKKLLIAILAGVLLVSSPFIVAEVQDTVELHNIQHVAGELLVPEGSKRIPTILERNTHDTSDFQRVWYDNANIAEELLELPDEIFEAALYSVYVEMDDCRYNGYINNWQAVLANLGKIVTPEQTEGKEVEIAEFQAKHPNAFRACHNCKTFEDFLKNLNLQDAKEYEKYGEDILHRYYDYIKQTGKNRGTDWNEPDLHYYLSDGTELYYDGDNLSYTKNENGTKDDTYVPNAQGAEIGTEDPEAPGRGGR